jgi:sterol O-acyltransferase
LEYQAQSTSLSEGDDFLTGTRNDIIKKASENDTESVGVYFPDNITLGNFFTFSMFPTLVYTLNFPRSKSIRWQYVFEKVCGIFGIIALMIIVAQDFMYPLVLQSIEIRNLPIKERLGPFLLILMDMVVPFLIQYIFVFFLIWDQILNAIAELSRFADREFYGPWWSSSDWADFARLWNKPVHRFLLRHIYHSSIASVKANKLTATLLTFVISSIVHEFVMYVIFNQLRGYLFLFQMSQIPLVMISRSTFLKNRKILGILICWTGFMTGPSIILTLYLVY